MTIYAFAEGGFEDTVYAIKAEVVFNSKRTNVMGTPMRRGYYLYVAPVKRVRRTVMDGMPSTVWHETLAAPVAETHTILLEEASAPNKTAAEIAETRAMRIYRKRIASLAERKGWALTGEYWSPPIDKKEE